MAYLGLFLGAVVWQHVIQIIVLVILLIGALASVVRARKTTVLQEVVTCYLPSMNIRTDYNCPECGEKTIYPYHTTLITDDLPACRHALRPVKGLTIALDESQLCRNCSPDAPDPALGLRITTDDGREYRVQNVRSADVARVCQFLAVRERATSSDDTAPTDQIMAELAAALKKPVAHV